MTRIRLAALVLLTACAHASGTARRAADGPAGGDAVEALLAADRAFAAAAQQRSVVDALAAMFRPDVVTGGPGAHVHGTAAAIELLRSNAENLTSRLAWTPIKGGVSSDGTHGFTQGYMSIHRARGDTLPAKYLAYWIREAGAWRVAVYKRVPRPAGPVSPAMLAPSLPTPGLRAADAAGVAAFGASLRAAEQAFSDEAQRIGIGPAFFEWGAPDAVNVGNGASWAVGPASIAGTQTPGQARDDGTTLAWSSSEVRVAATGDLGVSIGYIVVTPPAAAAPPGAPRRLPFFTVWKRASPADPWRYVAE